MPPLVSVLIPAYNAEAHLADAVRSVLAQTWPAVEVIVVNDGSRDQTLAVARSFDADQVKVFSQPNQGAPVARNFALSVARGEFIQYLDADDVLAPDKIERQMRRLAGHPGAIAACPWGRFYSRPDEARFTRELYWQDLPPVDWLVRCWELSGMMHPGVWLTSREVLDRAGPWDESLRQDQDGEFFCRAVLASRHVLFCDGTASYYRSGLGGSISRSVSPVALASRLQAAESRADNLLRAEDSERTRRACCRTLEEFAYSVYPDEIALWARAWARVERLGGPYFRPDGGTLLRLATGLLGWQRALRLRRLGRPLLRRLRSQPHPG